MYHVLHGTLGYVLDVHRYITPYVPKYFACTYARLMHSNPRKPNHTDKQDIQPHDLSHPLWALITFLSLPFPLRISDELITNDSSSVVCPPFTRDVPWLPAKQHPVIDPRRSSTARVKLGPRLRFDPVAGTAHRRVDELCICMRVRVNTLVLLLLSIVTYARVLITYVCFERWGANIMCRLFLVCLGVCTPIHMGWVCGWRGYVYDYYLVALRALRAFEG